jgi:type I restriction enzyme S subunit
VRAKAEGRDPGLPKEIADLFPDSFEPACRDAKHGAGRDSELGEIPRGWAVGKFGDCCDVKGGFAFKSKDFVNNGHPLVRIKNIMADKTVDLFDVVYIPESHALETKDFWLCDGDLVMAMTGATIGKYGLIVNRRDAPKALLNQRVAKITPKLVLSSKPWFVFAVLLVTDVFNQIVNIGGGSAQPNISSNRIENCRFLVPTSDLILGFSNTIEPLMEKWLNNSRESRTLATIRDTLLPKLMSGEVRVKSQI